VSHDNILYRLFWGLQFKRQWRYRVGQIKRGQCSFFRRGKALYKEFW